MIKLVAFDWNGTLLADTIATWEGANYEFKHFGYPPITLAHFRKTFAIPLSEYWLANGVSKKDMVAIKRDSDWVFSKFYEPRAIRARTRSGTRSLLKWLAEHDVESVIYSNHTLLGIEAQLKRLKIDQLINKILARAIADGASHFHQRSKDQKLLDYVKSKKFKRSEVMTIGDTCEEIEIGKKFNFHTVAITGGYNSTSRLKKAKPDFLIHNMVELEKIIKKINSL